MGSVTSLGLGLGLGLGHLDGQRDEVHLLRHRYGGLVEASAGLQLRSAHELDQLEAEGAEDSVECVERKGECRHHRHVGRDHHPEEGGDRGEWIRGVEEADEEPARQQRGRSSMAGGERTGRSALERGGDKR
eukprot:7380190-Prymnesium_polylepis.1